VKLFISYNKKLILF